MSLAVGLGGRKAKGAGDEGVEEENFPPIDFSFSSMDGLWEASDAAAVLGRGAEEAISDIFLSTGKKRSGSRFFWGQEGRGARTIRWLLEWQSDEKKKNYATLSGAFCNEDFLLNLFPDGKTRYVNSTEGVYGSIKSRDCEFQADDSTRTLLRST